MKNDIKNFANNLSDALYSVFARNTNSAEFERNAEFLHDIMYDVNEGRLHINLSGNQKEDLSILKPYANVLGMAVINAIVKSVPEIKEDLTIPDEDVLEDFCYFIEHETELENLNTRVIRTLWKEYVDDFIWENIYDNGYSYHNKIQISKVIKYVKEYFDL